MRKVVTYSIFILLIIIIALSYISPCFFFRTPSNFSSGQGTSFAFKKDGNMQAFLEGDMGYIGTYSCRVAGLVIDVDMRNAPMSMTLYNLIGGLIFGKEYVSKQNHD